MFGTQTRLLVRLSGLAVCLLVAITAIRSAAVELMFGRGDRAPFDFVARSAQAQEVELYERAGRGMSAAEAAVLAQRARAAIRQNPLSLNAPFALATSVAAYGNPNDARRLMRLAETRNPRNAIVRSWLASDAIRRRDLARAVFELDGVMRMRPSLVAPISRAMVPFLRAPGIDGALVAAARARPPWLDLFIDVARRDPAVSRNLHRVMIGIAADAPDAVTPTTVAGVVVSAMSSRDFAAARRIYVAFHPLASIDRTNLVIDPSFQRQGGPAPFGWTAADSVTGDIMGGNGPTIVAPTATGVRRHLVQSLILGPAYYRLTATAGPGDIVASEGLRWVVACRGQPAALAVLAIDAHLTQATSFSGDVMIPADCDAPILALDGGGGGTMQISNVALREQSAP